LTIDASSPSLPPSLFARCALAVVRFYQRRISPNTPPSCRFTPTCSEYMAQAILRYGVLHGSWLGVKRICRCHPWSPGGYDPVPGTESTSNNTAYEKSCE
jgi:hypothetical protein